MLLDNQIYVWLIDINQNTKLISQNSCLNETEIARANSFKYPELGEKWAFTRQALREILAQYQGESARSIEFKTDKRGKPSLSNNKSEKNIFFNLSHSGDNAIVAVTSICEIGVDIEKKKHVPEIDGIAKRFFSKTEQLALLSLPCTQRQTAFFRIWTRKEALIKANGLGMSMPLEQFSVPIKTFAGRIKLNIEGICAKNGQYYMYDVMIKENYDAALCLYSGDVKIEESSQLLYYDYKANNFA